MIRQENKERLKAKINQERQDNTKAGFCLEGRYQTGKNLSLNWTMLGPPTPKVKDTKRCSRIKAGAQKAVPLVRENWKKTTNILWSQGQLPVLNTGVKLSVKDTSQIINSLKSGL